MKSLDAICSQLTKKAKAINGDGIPQANNPQADHKVDRTGNGHGGEEEQMLTAENGTDDQKVKTEEQDQNSNNVISKYLPAEESCDKVNSEETVEAVNDAVTEVSGENNGSANVSKGGVTSQDLSIGGVTSQGSNDDEGGEAAAGKSGRKSKRKSSVPRNLMHMKVLTDDCQYKAETEQQDELALYCENNQGVDLDIFSAEEAGQREDGILDLSCPRKSSSPTAEQTKALDLTGSAKTSHSSSSDASVLKDVAESTFSEFLGFFGLPNEGDSVTHMVPLKNFSSHMILGHKGMEDMARADQAANGTAGADSGQLIL